MPIYDWECQSCGERNLNRRQESWKDPGPQCPKCNTLMDKILLKANVGFKGLSTPGKFLPKK
jgi:putative FmdB family regulatory protein